MRTSPIRTFRWVWWPETAAITWPALMSLLRVKEYLFTGDRIPAPVALNLGLANRVVPDGTALNEAIALATRLAQQPAQALRDTKRAVNKQLQRAMIDVLDFAVAAEAISNASPEHGEIVQRFLERERSGHNALTDGYVHVGPGWRGDRTLSGRRVAQ